jgi:glycosyltransferase involved in cell wall biosynthesis
MPVTRNRRGQQVPTAGIDRTRVLVWSPRGAGDHYHAPGMAVYRLYSAARTGSLEVSLGHGAPEQKRMALFQKQYFISNYSTEVWAQAQFLWYSKRWVDKNIDRFDVFHGVTSYHACVLPAVWAERGGVPSVLRIASHRGDLADKAGWRQILGLPRKRRALVDRLSGLIAISSAIAKELLSYGIDERRIAVIPNGVDIDRFSPLASETAKAELRGVLGWPDIPTILFVGRIHPSKQPHHLIVAAERMARQGYGFHLVFVGPVDDPNYFNRLTSSAEAGGLAERITWYGFTKDIARLYQASDVFVLPSMREGMSNALLEAGASGLALVSTRISGAADVIVDGQTGTLVEQSAESVTDALIGYLDDRASCKAHGAAMRRRAVRLFAANTVYDAHVRLFRHIQSPNGAARDATILDF